MTVDLESIIAAAEERRARRVVAVAESARIAAALADERDAKHVEVVDNLIAQRLGAAIADAIEYGRSSVEIVETFAEHRAHRLLLVVPRAPLVAGLRRVAGLIVDDSDEKMLVVTWTEGRERIR